METKVINGHLSELIPHELFTVESADQCYHCTRHWCSHYGEVGHRCNMRLDAIRAEEGLTGDVDLGVSIASDEL